MGLKSAIWSFCQTELFNAPLPRTSRTVIKWERVGRCDHDCALRSRHEAKVRQRRPVTEISMAEKLKGVEFDTFTVYRLR